MAATYDLSGTIVVSGVIRDVTPNKKGNGFNVQVTGKYITAVSDDSLIGTKERLFRFFDTLAEAKFYADSCVGTVEKVFTNSENGNSAPELERKATGAMRLRATGKHTEEHISKVNETRKGLALAGQAARTAALAAAAGGSI